MKATAPERREADSTPDWLEVVRKNVGHLRFGTVSITVHDGRVTQVESVEKTRFVPPAGASPAPR